MSTRKFYVTQLLPALDEFLKNYSNRDIDLGADIAVAARLAEILNSLPERVRLESPCPPKAAQFSNARGYRESTWTECSAYEFVCDFAIAYKHETVSRQGRKIDRLDKVYSRGAYCIYRDAEGQYYGSQKLLWLKQLSGNEVDLRRALVFSAQYWTDELVRFGIIEEINPKRFEYTEHMSRLQAETMPDLRIHQTRGEPHSTQFVVLEYDYEINGLTHLKAGTQFDIGKGIVVVTADSPFVPSTSAASD